MIFETILNYLSPDSRKGCVVVSLNKSKVGVYIDHSLAVGFTPGNAYPIDEGEHEIAVISTGYKTDPGYQLVDISVGDTTKINFNLIPLAGETGIVKLNVPINDAGIYADGEFKGTAKQNRILALPVGDHTITVIKPNYIRKSKNVIN